MTDIESVKNAQRLHHILQAVQRYTSVGRRAVVRDIHGR